MPYKFICIEGNIGVGKTTLVKKLAQHIGATSFFEEFDENPWLPLFYQQPKETALAVELSFLTDRCKQLIKIQKEHNSKTIISDYCLDKCLLFAKANLTKADFVTYKKLYGRISTTIKKPDIVIVLHTSVEALESNIRTRGRTYEQTIQITYLEKLNKAYLQFFSEEKEYIVLNINCETIDVKNYDSIFNEVVSFLKINNPDKNTIITI
jgi:deoxyadenosine/deoxycytidine kinase